MSYGLPYYQLASKWMATDAPIVAALLRVGDAPVTIREIHRMIGLGALLFAYAVDATSTPEKPPDGVFVGPADEVADLLEAAVQWDGARGALVGALIRAGVVERLEVGLRVRGTERYRRTWEKNSRRNTRKGKTGAQPAETGAHGAGNRQKPAGTGRETETETETETDESQQQHLAGASGDPPRTANGEQAGQQPPPAEISRPEPTSGTSGADFTLSAPQQKRARKREDKPADPRIRELSDRLTTTYQRVTGRPYAFQGAKDGSALPRLVGMLSEALTVDALDRRFEAGLRSKFGTLTGIADFAGRPNDPRWGGDVAGPRDVRRGTVRAEDEHHEQGGSIRDF